MERNQKLTKLSQTLRKNQTKEETLLWNCFLKTYPYRFRRQYVIGNYIVDFYCHSAKLAIELDGSQHYEHAEKDERRTTYLQTQGVEVLRFSNLDILHRFSGVCEAIDIRIKERRAEME